MYPLTGRGGVPAFYGGLRKIIRLGRLRFIAPGLALYMMGVLLAHPSGTAFPVARLAAGYLVILIGHLSMNYSNDVFDYEADKHGTPGIISGGSGILQETPGLRKAAFCLALSLLLVSLFLGAIFTWYYAYPAYFFGLILFGNLLGWFYAAPPLRLSYRGLGEIATIIGSGLLMPAMGALAMSGSLSQQYIAFIPPLILYSLSFIVSVEQPDMEADISSGKLTFVARKGRASGFAVMATSNLLATAYLAFMAFGAGTNISLIAFALSLLPLTIGLYGLVRRPVDRQSAQQIVLINVGAFTFFIIVIDVFLTISLR